MKRQTTLQLWNKSPEKRFCKQFDIQRKRERYARLGADYDKIKSKRRLKETNHYKLKRIALSKLKEYIRKVNIWIETPEAIYMKEHNMSLYYDTIDQIRNGKKDITVDNLNTT